MSPSVALPRNATSTGLDSIAPNLAWRIERQTRLVELDPAHTGQAWPALAWTIKSWENAGGDAVELIDELAPDRTLTALALALEAGHELTWHQRLKTIATAPHPLPWATAPVALHHSGAVPSELRDYLDHVADAITTRVDHLTDHAVTKRPAWTEAFGEAPTDEATFERWHTTIALAAAHRDQMRVDTHDPAHPFGPYPETGRACHHSWWAAASAALSRNSWVTSESQPRIFKTFTVRNVFRAVWLILRLKSPWNHKLPLGQPGHIESDRALEHDNL